MQEIIRDVMITQAKTGKRVKLVIISKEYYQKIVDEIDRDLESGLIGGVPFKVSVNQVEDYTLYD